MVPADDVLYLQNRVLLFDPLLGYYMLPKRYLQILPSYRYPGDGVLVEVLCIPCACYVLWYALCSNIVYIGIRRYAQVCTDRRL